MARRSGLGRGLGALIPTEVTNRASSLREIPLADVQVNQFQPRTQFAEEALSALVDSIKAVGVLQPVLVRPSEDGSYELIAGERRCRAARRAGLQTIPALVQEASDVSSLEQALVENIQREQLNPLDEAGAYQQLIEDFGLTHEDVARRVGRSRVSITNALRLFQLPLAVQRLVREEALSAGHARALLGTPDRDLQETLAGRAVEESQSVRTLEALVRAAMTSSSAREAEGEAEGSEDAGPDSLGAGVLEPTTSAPRSGLPAGSTMGGQDSDLIGSAGEGVDPVGATGRPMSALRPPGFLELEELLAARLDTTVRVEMTARRGRVVIEFATLEDLERIYRAMLDGRPE